MAVGEADHCAPSASSGQDSTDEPMCLLRGRLLRLGEDTDSTDEHGRSVRRVDGR